jgi:hypothetical protein
LAELGQRRQYASLYAAQQLSSPQMASLQHYCSRCECHIFTQQHDCFHQLRSRAESLDHDRKEHNQ